MRTRRFIIIATALLATSSVAVASVFSSVPTEIINHQMPNVIYSEDNTMEVARIELAYASSANDDSTVSATDYEYSVNSDNTVTLNKYNGTEKNIIIPSTIDGKTVSTIGYRLFQYSSPTNVRISEGISKLSTGAFYGCNSLESIVMPESLTEIKHSVFENCTGLSEIEIPKNVISIGNNVFKGCTNLSSINVSDNNYYLKSRDGILFSKDETILIAYPAGNINRSYRIPEGVQQIGVSSFAYCQNLNSLVLSKSNSLIGNMAFSNCITLEYIAVYKNTSTFGENILEGSTNTKIYAYAGSPAETFAGDRYRDINDFPGGNPYEESEKIIASSENDFTYIIDNGKITVTGLVNTNIKYTDIVVPNTIDGLDVTAIGDGAFVQCLNLRALRLPYSIEFVGKNIINNNDNMIIYGNSFPFGGNRDCVITYASENNIKFKGDYQYGTSDFDAFGDTYYYIKDKVVYKYLLEDNKAKIIAYEGTDKIKEITIPNKIYGLSVISITQQYGPKGTFGVEDSYQLMGLETLIIPEGIMYVEDPEQYGGTGLGFQHIKKLKIPSTLISMEDKYLSVCVTLSEIEVDPNNDIFSSDNGVLYSKDRKRLIIYPAGKRQSIYVVPSTVEKINNGAIYAHNFVLTEDYYGIPKGERVYCLDAVAIPKNVLKIEDNAINCYQFDDFIIYGYDNSVAKEYANTHDNIQFKDINEFPGGNPYENTVHLDTIKAAYSDGEEADINSVMTLKTKVVFSLTSPYTIDLPYTISVHDKIYIRKHSDDNDVANISILSEYNESPSFMPNIYGNWDINNGIINVSLFMDKIDFEANTQYYFDLSEVTINDHIHSKDYCRNNYNFISGFAISESSLLSFTNSSSDFFVLSEFANQKYYITNEFYYNEINSSKFLKNIYKEKLSSSNNYLINNLKWLYYINKRINQQWGGSCFGMSSIVLLENNKTYESDFVNYSTEISNYPAPKYTANVPYGLRDAINYYQVLLPLSDYENIEYSESSLSNLLYKARNINSINEAFIFSYGYMENSEQKGHAVLVLGADQNTLYLYNPNNGTTIQYIKLVWENNRIFMIKSNNNKTELNGMLINSITSVTSFLNNLTDKTILTAYSGDVLFTTGTKYNKRIIACGDENAEIAFYLPIEEYYEINSQQNKVEFSIVNDSMFFAAKADKAEKTIVDAENGIQLINADGSYELTVAVDDMPYGMFDISGIADGNVVCAYTNDGVLVNTANISDTVVTIWDDLETTDYTVPLIYDSFIVGENNNKEVILVDTDNNGTYETNLVPEASTPNLKGSVTLPGNDTGSVKLELINNSGTVVDTITSSNGKYSFINISKGNYTLRVSKEKYVTREYKVTIGDSVLPLDVKIHKYGDVNSDGATDAHDATQILLYDVGAKSIFTASQTSKEEKEYLLIVGCVFKVVDKNAILSPYDATQIMRYEVGLTSVFSRIV